MIIRKKEGSFTPDEAKIAKTLLARKWRNQDIQALFNMGRPSTINGARITEVKKNLLQMQATEEEVDFFIEKKHAFDPKTKLNFFDDERLIRSREAMLLAVQIFNSPTLNFKTEVFTMLIAVAWTYLLHEYYIRKNVKIIDSSGRSLLLSQMIKREDVPISKLQIKNLEGIIEIRNDAEHKLIGKSDSKWLPLFQASCLNFDKTICALFGEKLSLQNELSIALQFAKLNLEQITQLQTYDIPERIEALDARLKSKMTEDELNDLEYQFKVIYTLDSASKSQSNIQFIHPGSEHGKEIHNILAKYKCSDELYPHKAKKVTEAVKKRSKRTFSIHNHTQCVKKFCVRPPANSKTPDKTDKQYCIYHVAHKDYTYSDKWIEFLVQKISSEAEYEAIKKFKI